MADPATHWTDDLLRLDACSEAVSWAEDYDSLAAAWAACDEPRWLLWYAGSVSGPANSSSRHKLRLCIIECARLALKQVPIGEDRPRTAIEAVEALVRGGDDAPSVEDVEAAANAAFDAAMEFNDAAADAAYAAYATYAVCFHVDPAYVAFASADAVVRKQTFAECLAIVRRHYPEPPQGEERGA